MTRPSLGTCLPFGKRRVRGNPILVTGIWVSYGDIMIDVGQKLPAFSLQNQDGAARSANDYAGKWLVLYAYPKDDTPGCTLQACDLRDADAEFRERGAVVLGVSRDDEASHQRFKEKYSLPFTLLADEGARVAQQYGVWKEKSMYGKTFMGIERTTIVIDKEGRVRELFPNVSVEGHADEVLAALDS